MAFGASSGARQNAADGKIIIGTSVDMYGMNTGLQKIEKSFKRLQAVTGGALGIIGLVKFGKAALDAASDLQEVQNIVDVAFGEMSNKVESFAQTCIEKFGMSELSAKQTAGSFMAMGKSMGLTMEQASDMAISLTGLTGDMASFYNISQDYARVALSAVYTGETETLKRYGIVLTEANLQEYASTLGIQTKVKAMDASSKAMLRYQYILQATGDMQGDFARTSGSWANQVRLLREQWTVFLNVVGSGLITVLSPLLQMLNALLAAVIRFARVIGAALVNIFGLKVQNVSDQLNAVTSASEGASDGIGGVGDAAKTAGKNAGKANKELKKMLAEYDELKVIQKDTPSSAGSGGAGGGGGGGAGIGDFAIPEAGSSMLDDLKDMFSDIDNMFDLGKLIGEKITDSLNSIDWDAIQTKFNKFCKGIAEFLNGLISPELFSAVGHTIAQALNTAIGGALTFANTFDWTDFGNSLAAGVNTFFKEFDFKQLANAIDAWVQGLYNALKTFIENVKWDQVLQGIWDFLTELDLKTVEIIIAAITIKKVGKWILTSLLPGLITAVTGLLTSAFTTAFQILITGGSLRAGVLSFFEGIFGAGSVIAKIATALSGIALVISGLVLAVKNWFDMWENGWDLLSTIFEAIGIALIAIGAIILGAPALVAGVVAAIVFAVSQIAIIVHDNWDSIKAWAKGVAKWWNTNVIKPVVKFFTNMWKKITKLFKSAVTTVENSWKKVSKWFEKSVTKPIAKFFGDAWDKIQDIWKGVSNWFDTHVAKPVAKIFKWVGQVMKTVWITIKAIWIVISKWFNDHVVTPIKNKWKQMTDDLKSKVTAFKTFAINVWKAVKSWFNEHLVAPLKTKWNSLTDILKNKLSSFKTKAINVWKAVKSWFNEHLVDPLKTKWSNMVASMKTKIASVKTKVQTVVKGIKSLWESGVSYLKSKWSGFTSGIVSGFKGAVNTVIGKFEGFINRIIDGLNTFTSGLSAIGKIASKITGDDYSGIGRIGHIKLARLAKGAVIPPNKEFMAILGDQKQGTNIETPLDTMIEAFEKALDSRGGSGNSQPIVLQLNGKQIAQVVWDENAKKYKQTGRLGYAY